MKYLLQEKQLQEALVLDILLITFTGFKVAGNVEQLTLDHVMYKLRVKLVQVSTLHDGGALNPGTAYFL